MSNSEEQKWFKKFYDGTLLVKGWKHRVKEISECVSVDQREGIKNQLEILGEKIGREWSRDNSVRKIDTSMLQTWGDSLLKVKKDGIEVIDKKIASINEEVDKLLS